MYKLNGHVVTEIERDIPIYKKVGVVVAGSGSGGLGAAIAAARNGADTLLVERHSFLGGMSTASYQVWFGGCPSDVMNGISREMALRMDKAGGARYIERGRFPPAATGVSPLTYHMSFDPETWKNVATDMVEEAGCKVITNTLAVDAIVEDKTVRGIIIENKSGRQAILADVVIDATGDADIVYRAGAPIDKLPKSGYLMGMIMMFRVGGIEYRKIAEYARQHPEDFQQGSGVPPGDFDGTNLASIQGMGGWFSHVKAARKNGLLPPDFKSAWRAEGFSIAGINPMNIKNGIGYFDLIHEWKLFPWIAEDKTRAEFDARKRIRTFVNFLKTVPGFENSFLIDIAPSIGLQDSRRIIGDYVLTREDIREGRLFEDDIALVPMAWPDPPFTEDSGFMRHPWDGSEGTEEYVKTFRGLTYFMAIAGVPYRCLIAKDIDHLLAAGQITSMTYMAHELGAFRAMVNGMNCGQAAGTAAAMASRQGISPRKVNIADLQKTLISQGIVLDKNAIDMSEVRRMVESRSGTIGHVA